MIIVRYRARGIPKKFWLKLYGYSKDKYVYPGVLSRLGSARRFSDSTILIGEEDVSALEKFLKAWKVPYEKYPVEKPEIRKAEAEGPLRWDMPPEVLRERLKGFWEDMRELEGFIRTRSVRDAVEDTERFGY